MLAVLTVLTGVIYPLVITVLAQVLWPVQANGSLIMVNGEVVGSALIGQQTDDPRYFWWRPSAVNAMLGSSPDSPGSSGATNFGATNATLSAQVAQREATFRTANNLPTDVAVPVEMLFASGSGLDPHISPAAALLQIDRVAGARGLDSQTVAELVAQYTEPPQLSLLGETRVNVLLLNLALDEITPVATR